jgi:hypothetical protein
MTNDNTPDMLEMVAKVIAFCHYARGARKPNMDRIQELADRHWREFERDGRMVIEVINGLVQAEAFDDSVAALPQLPDFLNGTVN